MMGNKKKVNMEEYYSCLQRMSLPIFSKHLDQKTKCRLCLQEGDIPITSVRNRSDITEALNVFANIEIEDDKGVPTCLCYVCYKFLKSAMLFRKVALRTNEALKNPVVKQSPEHVNDFDNLDTFEDDGTPNPCSFKDVTKTEEKKKPKQKKPRPKRVPTKVQCPICKKLVGKQYYYNVHKDLHNPDLPSQFICDICGQAFKFKKVLLGHMERHETRYIFKCKLCPYAGRYKERLYMHMRIHTGELKFLCTHCPARYVTKGSLSAHIRLKHTEPQYKCNSCSKAYHNNLNLQRHIDVTHLGIKSNECSICGKAFGYRREMLDHQKNVHNKTSLRPFVRKLNKKTSMSNTSKQPEAKADSTDHMESRPKCLDPNYFMFQRTTL